MRLAKGFFLPLIAAEMRSKFCRPASGGRRADVRQTSGRRRAKVLWKVFSGYVFIFHFFKVAVNIKFPDAISEGFLSSFYCRWNAFKILPSGFGPASGRLRAEVLRDAFCEYKFIFYLF